MRQHVVVTPARRPGRTFRLGASISLAAVLAGCAWAGTADRLDRVSLRAGDAQERNVRVHAVDPIPIERPAVQPGADGTRVQAVIDAWYNKRKSEAGGHAGIQSGEP